MERPLLDIFDRDNCRKDLLRFVRTHWPDYEVAPHHQIIAEALEDVATGQRKRLMIFVPPRHGKSQLASGYFPAWFLGNHPRKQIIATSYSQNLAQDFGYMVREIIQDSLYEEIFETTLKPDSRSAKKFQLENGATYFGVGMGGSITGRGADVLIIDDPVKSRQAVESELFRNRQKEWYRSVAKTRLHKGGSIVIINTRWHPDDLSGWILREHTHEAWDVIHLPAIAEEDETWTYRRGDQWFRKAGTHLWDRYPLEQLEEIKTTIGTREFVSQYQQKPTPLQGNLCNLDWFRRYETPPLQSSLLIQSWDTGIKDKEYNDPSVCTTWAGTEAGFYLIDVFRERLPFPALLHRAIALHDKYQPVAVLIEDKGSGQSLVQALGKRKMPVLAIQSMQSKVIRFQQCTPLIESGQVYLPKRASWLADYEAELSSFPSSTHDDCVDSTSQALNWLQKRQASYASMTAETLSFIKETNRALDSIFHDEFSA